MITVLGIGADGWPSLGAEARAAVLAADLLVGGERQLDLVPADAPGRRRAWPQQLTALVDELPALATGRHVVVLASGDPLLYGVGATILRRIGDDDGRTRFIPTVSSYALACARLRWPRADVELVSATSRIPEVLAPALQPGRRLVVLGFGPATAAQIARVVRERGFGASRLVILEELGAAGERIEESTADAWGDRQAAALHLVALEVRGDGPLLGRCGLPDDAYEHDGQITKRDVRAVTLAALVPVPGQLLWDVGAGSGSVGIEWLRAALGSHAIAVERDPRRAERIARNALALGVPSLRVVTGEAPAVLGELAGPPDAIFVGGGLTSHDLLARCRDALAPAGRLVANVVTVEGETLLARAHEELGGRLTRIAIAHAEPLGRFTGWRSAMTVTQYELRVS